MNTTMTLLSKLSNHSQKQSPKSSRTSPSKLSLQRDQARHSYHRFSSLTKNEQLHQMRYTLKARNTRNPQWKHDYYKINNTFSVPPKQVSGVIQSFPHNNNKYNAQFSKQHLQNGGMNFTARDNGFFHKPQENLYSRHYRPIVNEKRKYNEDYLLRTSLFGKTWVDFKQEKIMDQYKMQINPFSTQKSNQLICLMRPARKHRFS